MTTKLLKLMNLADIPSRARSYERAARAKFESKDLALKAAEYEVVEAPGTFSGAFPRSFGWLCSREAADAVAEATVRMRGGTSYRMFAIQS